MSLRRLVRKIIPKEIRDNPIGQAALGAALGPAGFGVMSAAGAAATVGALSGLATGSLSRGLTAGMAAYGGSTALGMARGVDGGLSGLRGLASKIGFTGLDSPQAATQQLQANAAQAALQQKASSGVQGIAGITRPTQAARWGGGPSEAVTQTTNALATGANSAAARAAAVPATQAAQQVATTTQAPNLLSRAWDFAQENPGMTMMGLGLLGSMMERPQQAQTPQASGVPTTQIEVPRYVFQANPTGARAQGSEEVLHFNPQFVRMAEGGAVSIPDPLGELSGQSRQALGYLLNLNGLPSVGAPQVFVPNFDPPPTTDTLATPIPTPAPVSTTPTSTNLVTGASATQTGVRRPEGGSGRGDTGPSASASGGLGGIRGVSGQRALESAALGAMAFGQNRFAQAVAPGYALGARVLGGFMADRAIDNISAQMASLPGSWGSTGAGVSPGVARESVSPIARAAQMRADARAADANAGAKAAKAAAVGAGRPGGSSATGQSSPGGTGPAGGGSRPGGRGNTSAGSSVGGKSKGASSGPGGRGNTGGGSSSGGKGGKGGSSGGGRGGKGKAAGGIVTLAQGGAVPTLQEGSFVVPADVVSMIGNGSTDAGLRLLNDKINSHAGGGAIPLRGPGDGQSDDIPTTVEGKVPARVADGEAYISPDTVTRLGGGSLDKGTKRLYAMMDRVRKQAHGRTQQQRPVDIDKVL